MKSNNNQGAEPYTVSPVADRQSAAVGFFLLSATLDGAEVRCRVMGCTAAASEDEALGRWVKTLREKHPDRAIASADAYDISREALAFAAKATSAAPSRNDASTPVYGSSPQIPEQNQ